jgi:tetratricopeptide (TPR) repeat protein
LRQLGRLEEARGLLNKRRDPATSSSPGSIQVRVLADESMIDRHLAAIEVELGNFDAAESLLRGITQGSRGNPADLNNLAWLQLSRGKAGEEQISMAQRAVSLSGSQSAAALHTLASLYAETGAVEEAKQAIFQSLMADSREVKSADWYVFGRIYEQIGERNAALRAYRKVTPDSETQNDPTSPAVLAARRLKILEP